MSLGWEILGAVWLFPRFLLSHVVSKKRFSVARSAHEFVERTVAQVCIGGFIGNVVIRGEENIPSDSPGIPAPIYVANHASQIDVGVVYFLMRRFKWIAKKSVLYLPGVGQTMYMSEHIFIDRKKGKNKGSIASLYEKSNRAVQSGTPMFFFPQGTRWMSERLPFKDGAFNVALENHSCLIPVSIDIPRNIWNYAYPFGKTPPPVVLTVHEAIEVKGDEDKEALKKQCADIIYSVLPEVSEVSKKQK
eukprot:CAMPEP_0116822378 /NCGR_PEP_ID=MMETSP0418-20121206/234_1 /TAXON_ID=1158023 /ORGANISM="Astrosyne radiata, Strain 13vi08-1A" /LENGTH=246 /DNA_ID=CAMNT_0004450483 /DNA_START=94 /DNA_END=834 /DNA_ORIENTATION=+